MSPEAEMFDSAMMKMSTTLASVRILASTSFYRFMIDHRSTRPLYLISVISNSWLTTMPITTRRASESNLNETFSERAVCIKSYCQGHNFEFDSLTIFGHFVDTSWDGALRSIIVMKAWTVLQLIYCHIWHTPDSRHIQTNFKATQLLKASFITMF